MISNRDFDRRFKRTGRIIGIGGILITVLSIAITVGVILLAVHAVNVVQERGLKNVVEEIWEGPEE